jgi:hypothetical protein
MVQEAAPQEPKNAMTEETAKAAPAAEEATVDTAESS